jgi:hypothetical protein
VRAHAAVKDLVVLPPLQNVMLASHRIRANAQNPGGEFCALTHFPKKTAYAAAKGGSAKLPGRQPPPPSIRDWIRTSNLRLRRPTLYPVELRGQTSKERGARSMELSYEFNMNKRIDNAAPVQPGGHFSGLPPSR